MTTETIEIDETETDELTFCETCNRELGDAEIEDFGDECQACHEARVFVCPACECECERTDAHSTREGLCESCGGDAIETERTEAVEAAAAELQELVDDLVGNDDLAVIRKAIAALKRLSK